MALRHLVGWDARFSARSPWLWPLARAAAVVAPCDDWPSLATLDALYTALAPRRSDRPLRFAPDARARRHRGPIQPTESYDARIALRAEVPTRERHWHDLLNALCFATWPRSKLALHARQWRALQARAPGLARGARSAEQDALTLFDEGGVVIAAARTAAGELRAALDGADAAAITRLVSAAQAQVVPFGHALFEHMIEHLPCPGASARILSLDALPREREALLDALDAALARELADDTRFATRGENAHLRLEAIACVPPDSR
jgi:hypothetical protein